MRSTEFAVGLAVFGGMLALARAGEINNEFDTDVMYVLRGGTCESDVRMLDETMLDGPGPYVDGMDLGGFGPAKVISTPYKDPAGGSQDGSRLKSLCFSNSPVPGTYTPAGARLFGLYEVRSAEGPVDPENDWTYYSASFQIVELDHTGKRIRVMAVGLAASLFHDLPAPFDGCNNHSPDLLIAPWCDDDRWGTETRHNNKAGVRIGNIRYNAVKNTLMVAAVVGEWEIFRDTNPITGEPAYPKGRIYEFELPDWPEVYYESEDQVPFWCTNKAEMMGEPVPVSDPALVRLVQIYEMPDPHNVSANNGQTQNDNTRPSIDIDDEGNVYFTSPFFNATTQPNWSTTSLGLCWNGEGLWHGDVVRFSSLGHWAGRDVYHVPVAGDEAGNLIIQAQNQAILGHASYGGGTGLAVRPGNQLATVPRNGNLNQHCNGPGTDPPDYWIHLFDLTQTEPDYDHELRLIKVLDDDRCDWPRAGSFYTQRDDASGRIYVSNVKGACDCPQNFMCIQNDYPTDTVAHDLGYHLISSCEAASCIGHYEQGLSCELNLTWDAASPPPAPIDVEGACCIECGVCQSMTLADCQAAGGFYQGKGTTCGDYACPGQGACCQACTGECALTCENECSGWGEVWLGAGTVCDGTCQFCSPQPMDGDCDADVDSSDFGLFQICYTGLNGSLPPGSWECECFNANGDGRIDQFDYDVFEQCASGPNVPASESCADE